MENYGQAMEDAGLLSPRPLSLPIGQRLTTPPHVRGGPGAQQRVRQGLLPASNSAARARQVQAGARRLPRSIQVPLFARQGAGAPAHVHAFLPPVWMRGSAAAAVRARPLRGPAPPQGRRALGERAPGGGRHHAIWGV